MSSNGREGEQETARRRVSGVILAGGQSRRMGANKALMRLGDRTLIGHVIRRLEPVTDELLLVTNSPEVYLHLGLPMYPDILPDTGALGGLYTGLTCAAYDTVLCVACDAPFLVPRLLTHLVSCLDGYDAVMPYTEAERLTFQTLCAAYSKERCRPIIAEMLEEKELRVHALTERASVCRVPPRVWQEFDPAGDSFFNVNRAEDFRRAERRIGITPPPDF